MRVIADAGVFAELAAGAFGDVEGEFFDDSLGVWRGFDLHDRRPGGAIRQGLIGHEDAASFGKCQLRRRGALARGDGNHLVACGDRLVGMIQKGDLHLTILSH